MRIGDFSINSEEKEQSFCASQRVCLSRESRKYLLLLRLQRKPDVWKVALKLPFLYWGVRPLRFIRGLRVPATESQLALALALTLVFMAVMLLGLIWQADVIAAQRAIIHSLSGI
jgi:hypothetical protein